MIEVRRIYDGLNKDNFNVFVDRLYPRGVKKENFNNVLWAKDLAPSSELRKAYHKKEISFKEFSDSYFKELNENRDLSFLKGKDIVLLTAVKDIDKSHIPTLLKYLNENL